MRFYQRAFRYLTRKKGKTAVLFLVLATVNTMLLFSLMVIRATKEIERSMQEKTGAKIILETNKEGLDPTKLDEIADWEEVAGRNRRASGYGFLKDAIPVTRQESTQTENQMVVLQTYDDLEKDSPFSQRVYRMIRGACWETEGERGAAVNQVLAEQNGWEIGDIISVEADGRETAVEVKGIFLTGNEEKQGNDRMAVDRVENQIFVDPHTFCELYGSGRFQQAVIYSRRPEGLEGLEKRIEGLFENDSVTCTTSDALYQEMRAPLEQILQIAGWMFWLTALTGGIVVSLLLYMWMRSRQRETAILMSLGETKASLLLQGFTEAGLVFFGAFAASLGIGALSGRWMETLLGNLEEGGYAWHIAVQGSDGLFLLGMGSAVVLTAAVISKLPILREKPKEALSKL